MPGQNVIVEVKITNTGSKTLPVDVKLMRNYVSDDNYESHDVCIDR